MRVDKNKGLGAWRKELSIKILHCKELPLEPHYNTLLVEGLKFKVCSS